MRLLLLVLLMLVGCGVEPSMERTRDSITQAIKDIKAEGRRLNKRVTGRGDQDNRTYNIITEEVASDLLHDLVIHVEKLEVLLEEQQELIEELGKDVDDTPIDDKCPGKSEGKGNARS